jgi:ribosomal protein S18 acetylase RimI-like enzyme
MTLESGVQYTETEQGIRATVGGKEVGQLNISYTDSGRAVIVDVGVSRDYQSSGIGGRLTELAETMAAEHGATEIGTVAQPDYLNMLERRGYTIDGFFATKKVKPKR